MLEVIGKAEFERHADLLQIPLHELNSKLSNYKVAIRNYTSRRFLDINTGIRFNESNPKHLKAVKLLLEALDCLDTYDGEYVVRWSNLSEELLQKVKTVGNVIFEKGFTSTSANIEFEHNPQKEYKIVIRHYNGKYIGAFSEFPHEEEVLIPAFSFFRVEGFDEESKTLYLDQLAGNPATGDDGRGEVL
ncbi:ADP-ribosyltransferase domain-containing protein [Aliivibrio fischeri]|uniref:ADP-ribosyltransferase domain-containing protein n=1 Tax=Aliivibrio fischeri TaxID=668 RepID=UPI0007C42F49|nr:ADP-ribosyltransferase domain-containing protein [Aliivibrio fischeri]